MLLMGVLLNDEVVDLLICRDLILEHNLILKLNRQYIQGSVIHLLWISKQVGGVFTHELQPIFEVLLDIILRRASAIII